MKKKIAQILSISPKTVNTHVRNIMQKITINSKDYIVDFIEKAGKYELFTKYYKEIIREYYFSFQLNKIKAFEDKVYCFLKCDYLDDNISAILTKIKNILEKVNIYLIDNDNEFLGQYNFCLKLEDKKDSNNNAILNVNLYKGQEIILNHYVSDSKTFDLCMIEVIINIINNEKYDHIIEEISDLFKNLYTEKTIDQSTEKNNKSKILQIYRISNNKKFRIFLPILMIFLIICGIFLYKNHFISQNEFSELTDKYSKIFLADTDTISKNNKLKINFENFEAVNIFLDKTINKNLLQQYTKTRKIDHNTIVNYFNLLHAFTAHLLSFNAQYTERAYEILIYAKKSIENYALQKHPVKFTMNFDNASTGEVYKILDIVSDLPELYTKVIYSLGKATIYKLNKDAKLYDNAKLYFERSKRLGDKLDLYESYLSRRYGLELLRCYKISKYIKSKKYDLAVQKLYESIRQLEELLVDNKEYIIHNSVGMMQKKIVPSNDRYSVALIKQLIVKHYINLIKLAKINNIKEKKVKKYIDAVLVHIVGENGLLKIKDRLSDMHATSVYVRIAEFLLYVYNEHEIIDLNDLEQIYITLGLQYDEKNILPVVEHICNVAISKSKPYSHGNIEAHKVLKTLYKHMLSTNNLNKNEISLIKNKLEAIKQRLESVNKYAKPYFY